MGQWNGILCVFPTVAGRTYTVHYTLGLNGGPKLTPFVRNNITSANIQVQHITSDGRYTLTFVAPSSETMFAVENPNTGTRSMYLSYLFVQDVNAAAVVEDFYYVADVKSYSDYMPFGMQMPNRNGSTDDYRYGYQGSEMDNEVKGQGNSYTTHFRQLDPRVGRWLSLDPKASEMPWQSPYVSMDNNPIWYNDPLGDKIKFGNGIKGKEKRELKKRIRERKRDSDEFKEWYKARKKEDRLNYIRPIEHSRDVDAQGNKKTIVDPPGGIQFTPRTSFDQYYIAPNNGTQIPFRFTGNSDELNNVRFGDENSAALVELGDYVQKHKKGKIIISGITPGTDPQETGNNYTIEGEVKKGASLKDLVDARANTIKNILINDYGVDPRRIKVGRGKYGATRGSGKEFGTLVKIVKK